MSKKPSDATCCDVSLALSFIQKKRREVFILSEKRIKIKSLVILLLVAGWLVVVVQFDMTQKPRESLYRSAGDLLVEALFRLRRVVKPRSSNQ
jgi:hypothetical protein